MKRRQFNRKSRIGRAGFSPSLIVVSGLLLTGIIAGIMFVSVYEATGDNGIMSDVESKNSPFSRTAAERIRDRMTELKIEERFWTNRVELAKKRDLYLSVDLVENYVSLDMEGVLLRKCRVDSKRLGSSLDELKKRGEADKWMDRPFSLQKDRASLPKQPILVKDITSKPDTSDALFLLKRPVENQKFMFELEFDRDLRLLVYESGIDAENVLKMFGEGEKSDRSITLALDRNDVRAVYRALPDSLKMILRY